LLKAWKRKDLGKVSSTKKKLWFYIVPGVEKGHKSRTKGRKKIGPNIKTSRRQEWNLLNKNRNRGKNWLHRGEKRLQQPRCFRRGIAKKKSLWPARSTRIWKGRARGKRAKDLLHCLRKNWGGGGGKKKSLPHR